MHCLICGAAHVKCGGPSTSTDMVTVQQVRGGKWWTAPERLYLDTNGNVVKASDPARVSLLVSAGNQLAWEVAERYGLTAPPVIVVPVAPEPSDETVAETSAIPEPEEKKMIEPDLNKRSKKK